MDEISYNFETDENVDSLENTTNGNFKNSCVCVPHFKIAR